MAKRPRSGPALRTTATAVTLALTGLALFVAVLLVVLTRQLSRTTVSLGAAIESVRLMEEAEVSLLLYSRSRTDLIKLGIAGDVRRRLAMAGEYVTSDAERSALREATARVEEFVAADDDPELELAAFDALERLVDVNIVESRRLQAQAAKWDRTADIAGILAGVLVLAISGTVVWWLHRHAFQPVFALAGAMERFGKGDMGARAHEGGPRELREMISRFNEMAAARAAQRAAQAAFVAAVAHDLRTPLNVLMLQLELMRPDKPLPPEPDIRRALDRIRRQLVRLERMLGDLMDTAQGDTGQLELQFADADVREIVSGVVDLFQAGAADNPITLALPPEPVMLRCDRVRLEQVVTNLVSNAVKYSRSGDAVDVGVRREDDEIVLVVADHGIGISPEDQERLFEPFRRFSPSAGVAGAGLGLFVVRRIVEAHGGSIDIDSAVGEGSTFLVRLPLNGPPGFEPGTV